MNLTHSTRIRRRTRRLLTVAAMFALAGTALVALVPVAKASVAQPGLDITLRTQPSPLKTGSAQFEVAVKGSDGKPVTNADVVIAFYMAAMPEMKMPEMKNDVKLKPAATPGTYEGRGNIMMAGTWDVTVRVTQQGKEIGSKKQTLAVQ